MEDNNVIRMDEHKRKRCVIMEVIMVFQQH